MNNIAIVFQLAKKDILNPRYYRRLVLCFFIILVYFVLFLGESMEFARELGLRINVLEPILSLLATDFTHILFMGALLFLISDAPFRDKGDYYIVYRVGRLRWLSAKIMVMVYFVLLFVLVALLASLVFTLPAPEFKLTFSEFIQKPIVGGVNVGRHIEMGENILTNYTLMEGMLKSSLLFILWSSILGMIIVNCNLKYQRVVGVLMAFIPVVADKVITEVSLSANKGYLYYLRLGNLGQGDFLISVAVMVLVILALIALSLIQVGRHSMHEKE